MLVAALAAWAAACLPAAAQVAAAPAGDVRPAQQKPLRPAEVSRLIGGPTLVTLQFKDAPAKDVYDALARQAGITWREAEAVWQRRLPPLTVDIKRLPFWMALNTLEGKTGIGLVRWGGEAGYWLGYRGGDRTLLSGAQSVSGPFLLLAHHIERSETFSLALGMGSREPRGRRFLQIGLLLFVDPKLRVGRVGSLRLEDAVDESLQPLLGDNTPREQSLYGSSAIPVEGVIGFSLPAKRGRRIQRLMGTLRLTALTKSERWEIPAGATSAAAIPKVVADPAGGDRTFTFQALRQSEGPPGYEIELSYTAARPPVGNTSFTPDAGDVFTEIHLFDAENREWRRTGGNVAGGGDGKQVRYRFYGSFVAGTGERAPGPPVRLVWEIPVEYREIEVPFEFNDLSIP